MRRQRGLSRPGFSRPWVPEKRKYASLRGQKGVARPDLLPHMLRITRSASAACCLRRSSMTSIEGFVQNVIELFFEEGTQEVQKVLSGGRSPFSLAEASHAQTPRQDWTPWPSSFQIIFSREFFSSRGVYFEIAFGWPTVSKPASPRGDL